MIFLYGIACLFGIYTSMLPFTFSESSNRPLIPAAACSVDEYTSECELTCQDIYGNYLCSDEEVCCSGDCGEYCAVPDDYEPKCPENEYDDSLSCTDSFERCYDEAQNYLCAAEGKICCFTQCGESCTDPDHYEAVCPTPNGSIPCGKPSCKDIYKNDICRDGKICCENRCYDRCVDPDYYQVFCPNESVLLETVEDKRWTSFCLKDCDCHEYGQICCESPCGCELNICRYPIIKKASCPTECSGESDNFCDYLNDCPENGQLCCHCGDGSLRCLQPVFVNVSITLEDMGNPIFS